MPLSTPLLRHHSPRPESPWGPRERSSIDRRELRYKPMATTVTTTGLFGMGKRTKVEPIVNPPENPLVDEYLATAIEDSNGLPRSNSIPTAVSSNYEPDHPALNSWQDYRAPSPTFPTKDTSSVISLDTLRYARLHRPSISIKSLDSLRRTSTADLEVLSSHRSLDSINPEDLLPSEMNEYAGFCKGAWRQQIGDGKRAMEERVRPGGVYNSAKYFQCRSCKFEGRGGSREKSGLDKRVYTLVQGVQFRWEFMFKSHIPCREVNADPIGATFGCIFCCAEGRGTPKFTGLQAFMSHLVEHRERLPTGEVLHRMNCLVGRQAAMNEDFDVNMISRERGPV